MQINYKTVGIIVAVGIGGYLIYRWATKSSSPNENSLDGSATVGALPTGWDGGGAGSYGIEPSNVSLSNAQIRSMFFPDQSSVIANPQLFNDLTAMSAGYNVANPQPQLSIYSDKYGRVVGGSDANRQASLSAEGVRQATTFNFLNSQINGKTEGTPAQNNKTSKSRATLTKVNTSNADGTSTNAFGTTTGPQSKEPVQKAKVKYSW